MTYSTELSGWMSPERITSAAEHLQSRIGNRGELGNHPVSSACIIISVDVRICGTLDGVYSGPRCLSSMRSAIRDRSSGLDRSLLHTRVML